jgi:UDP-N-acetylglucosamine diphosphorylase / glucose-1-phosphate thymidylyltransferase / UDP-N-acetylgalactosamine diphosphorylase / glucosamine-1-phosphate N-acetyltransferase / galactosamine-1-phosphate N-acetyltransferase
VTVAVVMAAGEGTRLRPLTERWPKPVLPIDGRPVIGTLVRELAAHVARIYVVTGHLAEQVEDLLGDGSAFGVELVYARQPTAAGSVDAVERALAAGAEPPFLVSAADTVYTRGDTRRFADAAAGSDGAIAVRRAPPPDSSHRQPVRVENGLVLRVIDDDPANPLSAAPLWWIGTELLRHFDGAAGLADVLQAGVEAGRTIAGIEIGKTRDLTRPQDLVVENFPYLGS